MGVNNCFMTIRSLILNEKNKEISAEIIELAGDYDKERVTSEHDIRANAKAKNKLQNLIPQS